MRLQYTFLECRRGAVLRFDCVAANRFLRDKVAVSTSITQPGRNCNENLWRLNQEGAQSVDQTNWRARFLFYKATKSAEEARIAMAQGDRVKAIKLIARRSTGSWPPGEDKTRRREES
jgi:hypothetical protein